MCRCRRRARQPLPVPRACHTSPCLCTTSTSPLNLPAHPPLRLKCPLRSVLTLHSQDSEVALFQNWISKQNNLSIHLINTFIVFQILFGSGNGNPKRFTYTNQQLVYTNPICRSFPGNQIIKLATTTSGGVQYVPMGQVYPPSKAIKENTSKKLFVTSINSAHTNKSNQVNLIIPNNQTTTAGNKSPITNITLPGMDTSSNKGTITGMLVPNNPVGVNTNKQAVTSLLLPANSKYPNIAPNKKIFIPHILPQQNVTNKQTNVTNIIRQANNPGGKNVLGIFASNSTTQPMTSLLLTQNANNKNPQSSVGLIIPHSVAGQTHSILVSQSSGTQNTEMLCTQASGAQTHSIVVPQASGNQSHGIIMPPSSEGQAQMANVVLTTNSANATTPITSLLISNNSR